MKNSRFLIYKTIKYDLSHLNSFIHEFLHEAGGKSARTYRVKILFSHHCFTEGKKSGDDPQLEFLDGGPKRDHRTFDAIRWELSQYLPDIIRGLMGRHIAHTHHNSFFTVDIVDQNGTSIEYEVYFEVALVKKELYLTVTTAFSRDPANLGARPRGGKIRFSTILFNVSQNKPIKSVK